MDRLRPLLCPGPNKNTNKRWEYILRDERTKQSLIIENEDRQFSLYRLDADWPGRTTRGKQGDIKEKSADGLLVVSFPDTSGVCFIDLKGKMSTEDQQAHGLAQMESSARHFAPLAAAGEAASPTHGDPHHRSWAVDGEGEPEEPLPGHPAREHFVGGVFVLNRELARALPEPIVLAGKPVRLAALRIDRTDAPNVARIEARELCVRARLCAASGEAPLPPKSRGGGGAVRRRRGGAERAPA